MTKTAAGAGSAHADGEPAADGPPQPGRRQRFVLVGATALAVVAIGGLVASAWVQSPAEVAADTAPPPPDLLTAPVQNTVLHSTVVMPGTFAPGNEVSASPASVAATPDNPGGGPMVVTGVYTQAGSSVTAGHALIEYSGRPVYALPGAIPAYRDMVPGESGKDIAQLQDALQSLGFSCGWDASGVFGAGTENAVTGFYAHMGYVAPITGPATQQAVATAQEAYDQQSVLVRQLQAQTPSAKSGSAQLAQAQQVLQADATTLAHAQAADGPIVPMSEVLFVPQLPAVVQSVAAAVGDTVPKKLITLIDGGLQLTGQAAATDSALIKGGMKAQVSSDTTNLQATGTVAAMGTAAVVQASDGSQTPAAEPGGGSSGSYIPVSIAPDHPWNDALDGQNVRITITDAVTSAPVLAVPEAAISTGADGSTTVTALDASNQQHTVQVRAGASADGLVAVTPIDARLTAGERVVVGE